MRIRVVRIIDWLKGLNFFIKNNILTILSIAIALLSLSTAANYNRMSKIDSKLDELSKNANDYLMYSEQLYLIYTNDEERTLTTELEEVKIKLNRDIKSKLINPFINENNSYAKELKNKWFPLSIKYFLKYDRDKKLKKTKSYNSDEINKLDKSIKNIDKYLEEYENIDDSFKESLVNYIKEEKENNQFKLFYFF